KEGSEVGMLDNMLGLFFGAFRGAFIIALGFFLITITIPKDEYPPWLTQSITRPYAERGAIILAKLAPNYLREVSSLKEQAEREMRDNDDMDESVVGEDDSSSGYNRKSRRQLDRLIQGSGGEPAR